MKITYPDGTAIVIHSGRSNKMDRRIAFLRESNWKGLKARNTLANAAESTCSISG